VSPPIEPIGIPSELCICGHFLEDHDDSPSCTVIEHYEQCSCRWFRDNNKDDVEEEQNDEDFGE
jgi:hypothetical protein